jgi:hypothetical protein
MEIFRTTMQALVRSFIACAALAATPAWAIRPFITDDARVVGAGKAQIESWFRVDSESTQVWALPAYGPTEWLEVTAGGLAGSFGGFSVAGPLLQAKVLFLPAESNAAPGVSLVAGAILPFGTGGFQLPRTSPFAFFAVTQNVNDEAVLVHANVGVVGAPAGTVLTWGLGTQIRVYGRWNAIAEVISGDPYAETPEAGAIQAGFRFLYSDDLQFDGAGGVGMWGTLRLPAWITGGIRWVF